MKQSNGFTLIEIIIGINLGFLLLTVLVTFFLFSIKFISSTTKKLDNNHTVSEFLFRLNDKFKKCSSFYYNRLDSNNFFILDNIDTVLISKNLFSINNHYKLEGIEKYNLNIELKNSKNLKDYNYSQTNMPYNNSNEIITSDDIKEIEVGLTINNSLYKFNYVNPNISIRRFRNLIID